MKPNITTEIKDKKYYQGKREDLIKYIPKNAYHILDVGCGIGAMGDIIKKTGKGAEVVGVEVDTNAAETAKGSLDRVFVGNVEEIDLPFNRGYFDCIIYGDILEHLLNPWGLLQKHAGLLKDSGYVIASIPNIAHYRIIKMLKKKEWNYTSAGVVDKDHIRFFTIKSIIDMFRLANLKILKIENKIGASAIKKFLNKLLFNLFLDYLTEQYVVVAQK